MISSRPPFLIVIWIDTEKWKLMLLGLLIKTWWCCLSAALQLDTSIVHRTSHLGSCPFNVKSKAKLIFFHWSYIMNTWKHGTELYTSHIWTSGWFWMLRLSGLTMTVTPYQHYMLCTHYLIHVVTSALRWCINSLYRLLKISTKKNFLAQGKSLQSGKNCGVRSCRLLSPTSEVAYQDWSW